MILSTCKVPSFAFFFLIFKSRLSDPILRRLWKFFSSSIPHPLAFSLDSCGNNNSEHTTYGWIVQQLAPLSCVSLVLCVGVLSYLWDKHQDQRWLGETGFTSAYNLQPTQGRNWSILLTGLASLARSTFFLWVAPPTVGLALPHQLLIKNVSHRLCNRSVWLGQLLNWGSLILVDSSLYQVKKQNKTKLASTPSNLYE